MLRTEVDYLFVRVEVSNSRNVFVWLIYSNCNHEAAETRQRVRQRFEEDYSALIGRLGY